MTEILTQPAEYFFSITAIVEETEWAALSFTEEDSMALFRCLHNVFD